METEIHTLPSVIHDTPPTAVIEEFAFEVCQDLGEGFEGAEIARGLAGFLFTIARAHVKVLNHHPNGHGPTVGCGDRRGRN